jgi:AdoMet-dependent heme synthase
MNQEELVVVWRVYELCNLSCHFCGYSCDIVRTRRIVSPQEILRFGKILSEFQQRTGYQVLVSWLGGEPLLWKELPGISKKYHFDFGIELGLTTNGTLLDRKDIRDYLMENYSLVSISVDGFSDVHDFHRCKAGLFEHIKNSVKVMVQEIAQSQSLLSLRVNTILMRDNIAAFEAFALEIADWGIRELTFNQLGGIDRPEFYPDHCLSQDQAAWLTRELLNVQDKALKDGLKVFGTNQYLERISASSRNIAVPIEDCHPGRKFLFINEENLISPCNFTTQEYGIPVSEIMDAADLLKIAGRFHFKQLYGRAEPCNNCLSTQVFEKFNPVLAGDPPGNRR